MMSYNEILDKLNELEEQYRDDEDAIMQINLRKKDLDYNWNRKAYKEAEIDLNNLIAFLHDWCVPNN